MENVFWEKKCMKKNLYLKKKSLKNCFFLKKKQTKLLFETNLYFKNNIVVIFL